MEGDPKRGLRYVYGPVPSRRLEQSLGIDPIPFKTCNWNCVYCQLGRSTPMVNVRREYIPPDDIVEEVRSSLAAHPSGGIDWITFVGSGEPTLHAKLGYMIERIKGMTGIPIGVITNGSLLYDPQVRKELALADAVLPSVDAGNADLYRRINRPCADLTFDRFVDGLAAFRQEYPGKLWVETMLLKGVNDTPEALKELKTVMQRIGPDEVHLMLPVRPPAETWVVPSDETGVERARTVLGTIARVASPGDGTFDLSGFANVVEAVLAVIQRHPMLEKELVATLERWTAGQIDEALQELSAGGKAQCVIRYGRRFWSASQAHYADTSRKR